MKLIATTDFVLNQLDDLHLNGDFENFSRKVVKYAAFLKQPLKLEMFVPVDSNSNPLPTPTPEEIEKYNSLAYGDFSVEYTKIFDYIEAKNTVLFKGFLLIKNSDGFDDAEFYLLRNDSPQIFGDVIGNILRIRYPKIFAKTIEDLVIEYKGIELTKYAISKIGL